MVLHRFPAFTVQFFMLQAVGIAFESQVVRWAKPLRSNPKLALFNRGIGYGWMMLWSGWCAQMFFDPMSVNGYTFAGTAWMWIRNPVRNMVERVVTVGLEYKNRG